MSSESFTADVVSAMKFLQKRRGVTTRRIAKYLKDYCGYKPDTLGKTVRKVLRRLVRKKEATLDGYRYKLAGPTKSKEKKKKEGGGGGGDRRPKRTKNKH